MNSWLFFTLAIQALFVFNDARNIPNVCLLKADPGLCMAYFPRYHYNATEAKCKLFIYGGCQGNNNNFATLQKCENMCKVKDCPKFCTLQFAPVCGSDEKTYANECELKMENCMSDEQITILHSGLCDPCADLSCQFGGKCTAQNGIAKCQCSKFCTKIYDPVCGHDGTEYSNLCSLNIAECVAQKAINYDKGPCRFYG